MCHTIVGKKQQILLWIPFQVSFRKLHPLLSPLPPAQTRKSKSDYKKSSHPILFIHRIVPLSPPRTRCMHTFHTTIGKRTEKTAQQRHFLFRWIEHTNIDPKTPMIQTNPIAIPAPSHAISSRANTCHHAIPTHTPAPVLQRPQRRVRETPQKKGRARQGGKR